MKYIVEVNAKYLVNVEAPSALGAEHTVLDYKGYNSGIWGALAFDTKELKTDTFAGAVMSCETISLGELFAMTDKCVAARETYEQKQAEVKKADDEIERLEKLLRDAREAKALAVENSTIAKTNYDNARHNLGEQRA